MELTVKTKYSYGIGALGKDLVYAIVATYLMVYLTDDIGLNSAFVGTLFLVARFWDAINDTVMGIIVDNTRTRFGKFRPWLLIGTLINAVVLIFLFVKPDLDQTGLYIYFSIMYILWGMTYTIMDIPYWSMIPMLANDKASREKISVIPRIFASSAWIFIGAVGLQAINLLGNGDRIIGHEMLAKVIAVIFVVTTLITCFNVKEPSTKEIKGKQGEKTTVKQALKIISQNDQLKAFIWVVLAFNIVVQLSSGTALYYFRYVANDESLFSVFTTVGALAEIGGLVMFPMFAQKFGRNNVFKFGCFMMAAGLVALFGFGYLAVGNAVLVGLGAIILKLGSGTILGSSTVMLADVVDYNEATIGTRNESVIFSCQTLLVKTASAFAGWFIGVGLQMFGYVPNVAQSESAIMGMRFLMLILPAIIAVLSFIAYKRLYKLNNVEAEQTKENYHYKAEQVVTA